MSASTVRNLTLLLVLASLVQASSSRKLATSAKPSSSGPLKYHSGDLLRGDIPISILWYGEFKPAQKSVISDFILSLTPGERSSSPAKPSASKWWQAIDDAYLKKASGSPKTTQVILASQTSDEKCRIGKKLTRSHISGLAASIAPEKEGGVALVFTAEDVTVEGFCRSSCGTHGSVTAGTATSAYIWVGNSATQCPGHCAWPFHQPIYGPQTPPLVAPNNDVGLDGMVVNLASLLAGTVTNPFGEGYFQGNKVAPLEAASACPGVYGKGAYPGYAGELLVDPTTGASYNAHGVNGRKYLLPAVFDPSSSTCSTLV